MLASGAAVGATALATTPLTRAAGAIPEIVPARADRLADSFGIGIHLNFRNSVYGNHGRVIHWVERLGARHVRSRLSPAPDVLDAFARLSRRGIRVQGTCGAFGDDQDMDVVMRAVRRRYRRPGRVFEAFEGINEPNNDGVPWIEETRRKTRELHDARNRHGLRRIPIVAPALARVTRGGVEGDATIDQARNLGSLENWVDVGNMHIYPQGRPPSEDIRHYRRCAEIVAGDRTPVMCTEGGYFTAMDYHGTANPVPHRVAAAYGPQQVLEHWIAGTRRFFRYELLDEPDAGTTDREGTLGTVRTADGEWRPKSDFGPVRRLLRVFSDPGDQSFRRRPLRMALRNGPRDLRSASFVTRNGTHLVALWLDRYLYHPIERRMLVDDLREPMDSVDLVLDRRRDVRIEHLVDPHRRPRYDDRARLTVRLPAGVTIVKIR